ncbi:unnamed protein product [Ceratitis capitata]|uniref:(Mediterranean fruit fly) hypothetical protein n=1 Tax=Ceratitis capitata TaxID=7213 RepID=A0A811U2A3_CERCA|nr:unnamed protein product [Ceratitis capitata]
MVEFISLFIHSVTAKNDQGVMCGKFREMQMMPSSVSNRNGKSLQSMALLRCVARGLSTSLTPLSDKICICLTDHSVGICLHLEGSLPVPTSITYLLATSGLRKQQQHSNITLPVLCLCCPAFSLEGACMFGLFFIALLLIALHIDCLVFTHS